MHDYADIEVQAFILGIPLREHENEVRLTSYFAYGAHWIDDFFDNPELVAHPDEMLRDRGDIKKVLADMGIAGNVGTAMAEKAPHPEGVYKGLHRMLYGGLVQRSQSREERDMLVGEYFSVAREGLAPDFAREIQAIQPQAFWMTNKTVMEFIQAGEKNFDMNVGEVWNLIYAPALYYHDIGEEEKSGEASFTDAEKPRLEEMVRMIQLGSRYLYKFPDERRNGRIEQLRFLLRAFQKVLPREIVSEYEHILETQQK